MHADTSPGPTPEPTAEQTKEWYHQKLNRYHPATFPFNQWYHSIGTKTVTTRNIPVATDSHNTKRKIFAPPVRLLDLQKPDLRIDSNRVKPLNLARFASASVAGWGRFSTREAYPGLTRRAHNPEIDRKISILNRWFERFQTGTRKSTPRYQTAKPAGVGEATKLLEFYPSPGLGK